MLVTPLLVGSAAVVVGEAVNSGVGSSDTALYPVAGGVVVAALGLIGTLYANRRKDGRRVNSEELGLERRVATLEANFDTMRDEQRNMDQRITAQLKEILDHVRPWGGPT